MKKLISIAAISLSFVSLSGLAVQSKEVVNLVTDAACSSLKHNNHPDFCSCFKDRAYDNCAAAQGNIPCGYPYSFIMKREGALIKQYGGVTSFCTTYVATHLPNINIGDCIADNSIMFADSGSYHGSCPIS